MRQEELEEQGKSKSTAREVLDWILYIGIVLILSWLIVTFVGVRDCGGWSVHGAHSPGWQQSDRR